MRSSASSMLFLLFSCFLLGQVFAGPKEDLVDKILSAYLSTNIPKNVTVPHVSYPSEIGIGPLSSSFDVHFDYGFLEIDTVFRIGSVKDDGYLKFTGQINAEFSFMYDFQEDAPSPYSSGRSKITWDVPVSMQVAMDTNKASLVSSVLLQNGTLVAKFVPFHAKRSATLYITDDSLFASILYKLIKKYLDKTFKNIVVF